MKQKTRILSIVFLFLLSSLSVVITQCGKDESKSGCKHTLNGIEFDCSSSEEACNKCRDQNNCSDCTQKSNNNDTGNSNDTTNGDGGNSNSCDLTQNGVKYDCSASTEACDKCSKGDCSSCTKTGGEDTGGGSNTCIKVFPNGRQQYNCPKSECDKCQDNNDCSGCKIEPRTV